MCFLGRSKEIKNYNLLKPCTPRFLQTGRKWHNPEGKSPEQNLLEKLSSSHHDICSLCFAQSLTSTIVADFVLSSIWGLWIQLLGITLASLKIICRINMTLLYFHWKDTWPPPTHSLGPSPKETASVREAPPKLASPLFGHCPNSD